MSLILQKFWTFITTNWRGLAALSLVTVLCVGCWLEYTKVRKDFTSQLEAYKKASEEEMNGVLEAHRAERAEHEANIKKLQDSLSSVQQQYDEAKLALEAKKKDTITKIVVKYADDPTGLAQKVGEVTGFKVVSP